MVIVILAGGLVTILYTYRLQEVASRILAENVSSLKAAQELEIALFRMRGLTINFMLDGDTRWLETLQERKREFQSSLDAARASARTAQEDEIVYIVAQLSQEYEQQRQRALALFREGKAGEAQTLMLKSNQLFDEIYTQCEAFVAANEQTVIAAVEKSERTNAIVRTTMYGLGVGGILLGVMLGWIISRSIVNPIYELVLKVRAAGGEFVQRVGVNGTTEIEELDRHIHALIDRINAAMADLERNRKLLARAEKFAALGKVAASVAHEIRNPLTAIKMLIYAMHEDPTADHEKRKDLAVVLKEIDRVERFVENFLQFARPPAPLLVPTDIDEAVHETLTLLAPRLQQNGIALREIYRASPRQIIADTDQLRQVVMNLVINAIESMPEGGRLTAETLSLPPAAASAGKPCALIRISDTGRGIPTELLDSIFDPFVSGRRNGVGLGLSVAYQIVNQHEGWLEGVNNADGGATFTVRLPQKEGPATGGQDPQDMRSCA
ncbi:MCP four helix bundle domain-containing protein [candidate division KSB1 bacterium]|nr:ATP-binding protein [bacterium]NUM68369.1 MCP four helix bundle domain-containing protein [candidate division KSB1 bacterium]